MENKEINEPSIEEIASITAEYIKPLLEEFAKSEDEEVLKLLYGPISRILRTTKTNNKTEEEKKKGE